MVYAQPHAFLLQFHVMALLNKLAVAYTQLTNN